MSVTNMARLSSIPAPGHQGSTHTLAIIHQPDLDRPTVSNNTSLNHERYIALCKSIIIMSDADPQLQEEDKFSDILPDGSSRAVSLTDSRAVSTTIQGDI